MTARLTALVTALCLSALPLASGYAQEGSPMLRGGVDLYVYPAPNVPEVMKNPYTIQHAPGMAESEATLQAIEASLDNAPPSVQDSIGPLIGEARAECYPPSGAPGFSCDGAFARLNQALVVWQYVPSQPYHPDAFPGLQFAEGFSDGWKRCMEENLAGDLMSLPISFLSGKYKTFGQLMQGIGRAQLIWAAYNFVTQGGLPRGTSIGAYAHELAYRICNGMDIANAARNLARNGVLPGPEDQPRGLPARDVPDDTPMRAAPDDRWRGQDSDAYRQSTKQGYLGEVLAAWVLDGLGFKILALHTGIGATTAPGGADIIAFRDGELFLVDNKAYNGKSDVLNAVSSLTTNLANTVTKARVSLEDGLRAWGAGTPEGNMYAQALERLDAGDFHKLVMNARVLSDPDRQMLSRVSETLRHVGIEFLDVRDAGGSSQAMPVEEPFHTIQLPPQKEPVYVRPFEVDRQ